MGFRLFFIALLGLPCVAWAQPFTQADTLRGSNGAGRNCYDVGYYELSVAVDVQRKTMAGSTLFRVKNLKNYTSLQIDIFNFLTLDSIIFHQKKCSFIRQGNACFVQFPEVQRQGQVLQFEVFFRGTPMQAKRPPWDGGFVWRTDSLGQPWVGVACQGLGASSWWACKDYLGDEPDSMRINISHPNNLVAVSNGYRKNVVFIDSNTVQSVFEVKNPINTYNVTLNLANYTLVTDEYTDVSGQNRTLEYYVLVANAAKAQQHFGQVKDMLRCFEQHFGAYPFWSDGYRLVETSYWGMEHQSCVAYGNNYKNNAFGFDFIIVHESGHEWFGNSVSVADQAEMWIHEGFTTYAETIFVECMQGKQAANQYIATQKQRLVLKQPIVGILGVNDTNNDVDIYFKAALMLHTLRQMVNNDPLWFATIKRFALEYKKSFVNTAEVITFFNKSLGKDYTTFFAEYLNFAPLPVLHYKCYQDGKNTVLQYKYHANQPNFKMPLSVVVHGKKVVLDPKNAFQKRVFRHTSPQEIQIDAQNYLVTIQKIP